MLSVIFQISLKKEKNKQKMKLIMSFFKKILIIFIIPFFSFGKTAQEKNDVDFIMHHIGDAHEWHLATVGNTAITIPLPIIIYSKDRGIEYFLSSQFINHNYEKVAYQGYIINEHEKIIPLDEKRTIYDFSITKNIVAMLVSMLVLCIITLIAAKYYQGKKNISSAPKGITLFLEMMVCYVRDEIAIPNIGKKKYKKFMPYLLTVFFFIWINNLLGLLPGAANVTGNISITLTLALFTFSITTINGNQHYWSHIIFPPGTPIWLLPIMIPIEIIGLFVKPFSLMIRLFANITAGHIILLTIIALIFIFENVFISAITVPFGTFMFLLKLIVAFLQAYVFTLLSAIYFGTATK